MNSRNLCILLGVLAFGNQTCISGVQAKTKHAELQPTPLNAVVSRPCLALFLWTIGSIHLQEKIRWMRLSPETINNLQWWCLDGAVCILSWHAYTLSKKIKLLEQLAAGKIELDNYVIRDNLYTDSRNSTAQATLKQAEQLVESVKEQIAQINPEERNQEIAALQAGVKRLQSAVAELQEEVFTTKLMRSRSSFSCYSQYTPDHSRHTHGQSSNPFDP